MKNYFNSEIYKLCKNKHLMLLVIVSFTYSAFVLLIYKINNLYLSDLIKYFNEEYYYLLLFLPIIFIVSFVGDEIECKSTYYVNKKYLFLVKGIVSFLYFVTLIFLTIIFLAVLSPLFYPYKYLDIIDIFKAFCTIKKDILGLIVMCFVAFLNIILLKKKFLAFCITFIFKIACDYLNKIVVLKKIKVLYFLPSLLWQDNKIVMFNSNILFFQYFFNFVLIGLFLLYIKILIDKI